jgi:hypothetical protein
MSGRTRSQNRNRSRGRNRNRGMMGGSHAAANVANAGSGGGAADWVIKNFGLGDAQWNNTFGPQSLGINTGNLLPTVTGAPAVLSGMTPQGTNSPSQLLKMSGGRRRRRMKRTKGGMGMIATAAVPLTLLALQQSYGTRRKGSRRRGSRRRGSRRGSRRR